MPKKRFPGPCIICNKVEPSGYYSIQMCVNCYRKQRRRKRGLKHTGPYKVHLGPCTICNTMNSSNGRFIKGMCSACYRRVYLRGNLTPRTKFNGPCIVCGKIDPKQRFYKEMCGNCYNKDKYAKKVKSKKKFCSDCNKEISRLSKTGQCPNCRHKFRYATDEEYRIGFYNSRTKYLNSEKGRDNRHALVQRRYSIMNHTEPHLSNEEWKRVLEHFNYCCVYCGKHLKRPNLDHYIPLSKGGTHTIDNVVPCCKPCNSRKKDGPPPKNIQLLKE